MSSKRVWREAGVGDILTSHPEAKFLPTDREDI